MSSAKSTTELAERNLLSLAQRLPGSPPLPVVADANALIDDVIRVLRTGRSLLSSLAEYGLIGFTTAAHIPFEVDEHLAEVVEACGLDTDAARAVWERLYVPHLRLVSMPALGPEDDPRLARVKDEEDVPVGQAAVLLAPCLLTTRDRHLRDVGLGEEKWADALVLIRDLVELDFQLYGGARTVELFVRLVGLSGTALAKRIAASPVALAFLGALVVLLLTDGREAAIAMYRRMRARLAVDAPVVLEAVAGLFEARTDAQQALHPRLVHAAGTPTPESRIARLLITQTKPLPAAAITAQLNGYLTEAQVRNVLRTHPAFELQVGRGWTLGHYLAASTAALPNSNPKLTRTHNGL